MNPLALLGEFRAETSEHLNALDAHMVELERNPADRQPLRELFRSAHTIKGGAALLGLTDVLELAHALEDVLGSLRDGQAPLERATTELLFRAMAALRDLAPRAQPGSPCRSAAGDEVIAALRQDALRIASPHQAVDSPAEPEPRQVLVVDDSAPIAPLRVLLVDDSTLHQRVGRHMLQVLGYRVDVVDDGSSALLALADVDYAAVLMDCQLAGMDGLETTQHIRRSAGPTARRTPIIALTADNRAEDRARCLASGMDDILTKPVELADLEACLTRWTRSPTVAVPNILPSPVDTGVLLALRALVQPGQPDPVAPLIKLFVQESRGRLADCAAAVRLGNTTELAAAAHALKGNSGTFGAGEMHRLATDLEHGARSGSIGSALEILAEMDTEFVRVVQALDAFASQVQYGFHMPAKRVLIVDDQQDMREMARLGMQLAGGWDVLTASSGQEALKTAASQAPDIILLDVMMPDMDGPSTARQLHADPSTSGIPVILLTAEEHVPSQPGVIGTIAKPFHPLKLAAEVSRILETVR